MASYGSKGPFMALWWDQEGVGKTKWMSGGGALLGPVDLGSI